MSVWPNDRLLKLCWPDALTHYTAVCCKGWWKSVLNFYARSSMNVYSFPIMSDWLMAKIISARLWLWLYTQTSVKERKPHQSTFVLWKSECKVITNQEERVKQPLPFILVWETYLLGKQDSKQHSPPLSVTNIWVSVVADWVSREKKGLVWLAQIGQYDHTVKTQLLHSLHNRMSCTHAGLLTFSLGGVHDIICSGPLHISTRKCVLSQTHFVVCVKVQHEKRFFPFRQQLGSQHEAPDKISAKPKGHFLLLQSRRHNFLQ